MKEEKKLTIDNFMSHYLRFSARQAGVSISYCPDSGRFIYNAYCIEIEKLKELYSVEYEFLEDALDLINSEFQTWELIAYDKGQSGCGSCSNKK